MRPLDGEIGVIEEAMRVEVADARWLPLDEAPRTARLPGRAGAARRRRASSLAPGDSPPNEAG